MELIGPISFKQEDYIGQLTIEVKYYGAPDRFGEQYIDLDAVANWLIESFPYAQVTVSAEPTVIIWNLPECGGLEKGWEVTYTFDVTHISDTGEPYEMDRFDQLEDPEGTRQYHEDIGQ